MKKMFRLMADKLRLGEDLVLVTVVASSGATPRGAGARMLIGREGRLIGTIGGGSVEYRSEQIAAQVLLDKSSGEHDFSLTKDDVKNLGMICGGAVNVFFSFIPAGDVHTLTICDKAAELFASGCDIWLLTDIKSGGKLGLYSKAQGFIGINCQDCLVDYMTSHPQRVTKEQLDIFVEKIYSSGRVFVFGCGHVAQELVPVLSHVGFRCVAMDDRAEFATPALFPSAEKVILIDFENINNYIEIGPDDYACIMTRGHGFDTVVQAQVLSTPACYIGVIGSANKKAGVFQILKDKYGCTDSDLERIATPIGIKIKAETPAEIAISIAAEMIMHRAMRNQK